MALHTSTESLDVSWVSMKKRKNAELGELL